MSFAAVISQVCEEKLEGVKLKKGQSLAVSRVTAEMWCYQQDSERD